MPLVLNGVEVDTVNFNGTEVDELYLNGTKVFDSLVEPELLSTYTRWEDTSNTPAWQSISRGFYIDTPHPNRYIIVMVNIGSNTDRRRTDNSYINSLNVNVDGVGDIPMTKRGEQTVNGHSGRRSYTCAMYYSDIPVPTGIKGRVEVSTSDSEWNHDFACMVCGAVLNFKNNYISYAEVGGTSTDWISQPVPVSNGALIFVNGINAASVHKTVYTDSRRYSQRINEISEESINDNHPNWLARYVGVGVVSNWIGLYPTYSFGVFKSEITDTERTFKLDRGSLLTMMDIY